MIRALPPLGALTAFSSMVLWLFSPPALSAPDLSLSTSMTWWTTGSYTGVLPTSPFNTNNAVSEIPKFQIQSDVRPDLKIDAQSVRAVIRPRLQYRGRTTEISGQSQSRWNDFQLKWSDAFGELRINDTLFVTYGLQNYQWGPAESASPSHPIFHETVQVRDLLFAVNGRHLFRANLTPLPELSIVGMVELTENVDGAFVAEQVYLPTFALKADLSWAGGASQAALVLGGTRERLQLGQTLTLDLTEILEGLSIYADASQQLGANVWYPNGVTMEKTQLSSSTPTLYSVLGARYAFESGEDLRVEFLWQGAGYSPTQRSLLLGMLSSTDPGVLANLAATAARASRPGVEFPGQKFSFLSLRVPNVFKNRDWTLYVRYLTSLTDWSGSAFLTFEAPLSDSGALLFSGSVSHGSLESEIRGLTDGSVVAGYRHVW